MTIAAFLCGLFYGAFLYAAWLKERDRRRLNRILSAVDKALEQIRECECGECCGCGAPPEVSVSYGQCVTSHTGFEDG